MVVSIHECINDYVFDVYTISYQIILFNATYSLSVMNLYINYNTTLRKLIVIVLYDQQHFIYFYYTSKIYY